MSEEFIHSLVLIVAIAMAFLFPQTPFKEYDLQIIAFLFIILFIAKRFFKLGRLLESVIFTLIIYIIVTTTGGVSSRFFFLLYFLLFSLALLLEPVVSLTTTIASVLFFVIFLPAAAGADAFLPLISLFFLTPFAIFMGKEYIKNEKLKTKNEKDKTDTLLFLSLLLKAQIEHIKRAVENFTGEHEASQIKKSAEKMEELIEKFEKEE